MAVNRAPRRFQLKRTRGWRMPEGGIKCDRSTILGNPFDWRVFGRDQAVALHRVWLTEPPHPDLAAFEDRRLKVLAFLPELRGHDLGCWCAEPEPYERDRCHVATILELANR